MFCTGSLRPEVQPPTLLFSLPIFDQEGTPFQFVYFLLTNATTFTYLVYNFASF